MNGVNFQKVREECQILWDYFSRKMNLSARTVHSWTTRRMHRFHGHAPLCHQLCVLHVPRTRWRVNTYARHVSKHAGVKRSPVVDILRTLGVRRPCQIQSMDPIWLKHHSFFVVIVEWTKDFPRSIATVDSLQHANEGARRRGEINFRGILSASVYNSVRSAVERKDYSAEHEICACCIAEKYWKVVNEFTFW